MVATVQVRQAIASTFTDVDANKDGVITKEVSVVSSGLVKHVRSSSRLVLQCKWIPSLVRY